MRRYPAYRDSGVDWLGEVPEGWEVVPAGYRYEVQLGRMLNEQRAAGDHLRPYLRVADVQWGRINVDDLPLMDFPPETQERYRLAPGDLLVNEGGSYVGRSAIWRGELDECYYQKALHRLRPRSHAFDSAEFFLFVMEMATTRNIFAAYGNQTTIDHLTADQLRAHRFAFPPLPEQTAIAAFLDRETAKIDALVGEQRRLIALLLEKRQAVISHAVTRGLNPTAPLKPSGIDWLGDVPEGWEVRKLKFLLANAKAGPFGSSLTKDMYVETGYRVYGQEQVIPGDFSIGNYYISAAYFAEMMQYEVLPGDILISCVGSFGKVAVVPPDIEPGIINPRLIRLRVSELVSPDFLSEVLRSPFVFQQFDRLSRGGTMDVINLGALEEILIPLPPTAEQLDLLRIIRRQSEQLDSLITTAESAISLLQERRAALISAAVTGKIDVRDALANGTEAA